jgi:hypothetical protein
MSDLSSTEHTFQAKAKRKLRGVMQSTEGKFLSYNSKLYPYYYELIFQVKRLKNVLDEFHTQP